MRYFTMRLVLTREHLQEDNSIVVQDINLLGMLVEVSEANEILVDFFLGQFSYEEVGGALSTICSRLRKGGTITVREFDIELLSLKMLYGGVSVEDYNNLIFSSGPIKSFVPVEVIVGILGNSGIEITQKTFDDNCNSIVVGTR